MGVEIIGTDADLFKDLTRDFNNEIRQALDVAAQNFVQSMLDRTDEGIDVNGKPFAPYQGSYKEQIQKYGKVRVGKNRFRSKELSPVNLTVTGKMRSGIKTRKLNRKTLNAVEVYMTPAQAKKARGIQFGNKYIKKKREFFAVSKDESQKFFEDFKQELRILKNDRGS